jgi:aryl-alcohol dehydrogenase-like predicted oxidoreductase
MDQRRLGRAGPEVSALGLGLMGMSGYYGHADEGESLATIEAALEAGITLIDTADFYRGGHSEMLLARALREGRRERAFISVKFGALREPGGHFIGFDARPAAVKNFISYTLQRLNTDHVDLYMPARLDPAVPIEETVGAIADLVKAGHVRHIGLSEVSAETIRRAHAVHPIAALEIEYSLFSRGVEQAILPTLRELGISLIAYGAVCRGLIDDPARTAAFRDKPSGIRVRMPRFQGENLDANRALVQRIADIAADVGCTVGQLAFAWLLSRGEDVVPLIGTKRRERLAESLVALDVSLDAETIARLEAAVPPGAAAGERYSPALMAELDSERALAG